MRSPNDRHNENKNMYDGLCSFLRLGLLTVRTVLQSRQYGSSYDLARLTTCVVVHSRPSYNADVRYTTYDLRRTKEVHRHRLIRGRLLAMSLLLLVFVARHMVNQPLNGLPDRAVVVLRSHDSEHRRHEAEREDDREEDRGEEDEAELDEVGDLREKQEGRAADGRQRAGQHRDADLGERVLETPEAAEVQRAAVALRQVHDVVDGQTDDQRQVDGLRHLATYDGNGDRPSYGLWVIGYRLSVIGSWLAVISYQLSVINHQLLVMNNKNKNICKAYMKRSETKRKKKPRPDQARPGQARPGQARPGQARPGQARPGQARPGQATPGHARPGHARPRQARQGKARQGQARPRQARPRQATPGQATPGQARPG